MPAAIIEAHALEPEARSTDELSSLLLRSRVRAPARSPRPEEQTKFVDVDAVGPSSRIARGFTLIERAWRAPAH
jgi:hypothetical protein